MTADIDPQTASRTPGMVAVPGRGPPCRGRVAGKRIVLVAETVQSCNHPFTILHLRHATLRCYSE
ncbi:hypothetical protein E2C01_090794 [Portunus trituberculatus]|uniref:Uncharacterized protein n=1 Tax=Portunus trituberculatus TaxID=210409 RepID=A0A5B7JMQ1_PORTR|nr:hypothetical protein [Portunus trituberculatus]